MHRPKRIQSPQAGFTLLFAVFAAALLLSIGISIYTIAVKELLLSSAGRESQRAFAAADAGSECALYWDFQHQAFMPVAHTPIPILPASNVISCGDTVVTVDRPLGYGDTVGRKEFTVNFNAVGNCARIVVTKYDATFPGCSSSICTVIEAEGYNTCTAGDPVRLQRTIRVTY